MTLKRTLIAGLALFGLTGSALAADLTISVSDIRNDKGKLLVALFDTEKAFQTMDEKSAYATFSLPARRKGAKLTFHDLPKGRYAIGFFHDENNNNVLDMNSKGFPFEGYGMSNNSGARKQVPTFKDAAFTIDKAPVKQALKIIYLK
jgi:uncharacterized protein (DUF2141 family)